MKYLPRILLLALLLTSVGSFADAVNFTNLNVNFDISANDGTGDNLGGTIVGSSVNLFLGGGIPFDWFNSIIGYAPGSAGGGTVTIFFEFAQGTLGGQSFSSDQIVNVSTAVFDAGGFTFPTNGKDFTATVPASIEVITVLACDDNGNCPTYTLTTKPGKLTLSFVYYASSGMYFGTQGSFTTIPEPGTMLLVSSGIGALVWGRRHRRISVA